MTGWQAPTAELAHPADFQFEVEGESFPLHIEHSPRARRMKLKITAIREVILVLPKKISIKTGLAFARNEKEWVRQEIRKLAKPVPFEHGTIIPILGENHSICHVPKKRRFVWQENGCLYVSGGAEHLPRRVKDWASQEIKKFITVKSGIYARSIDVRVQRITIRDQKSRWGSCSSAGSLNFSWRLIFMPEEVAAYIIAHEVAHLKHMNHSVEFWQLVEHLCPEMGTSKQWLKKNGASLHKYGATF